jgi:8-oxo-dGTP diphosphatase
VAAVIRDGRGRMLLVRKRGTGAFMQPGGKREAGEGDLEALARELEEEIGCGMARDTAVRLGQFRAPAANEGGRDVVADIYAVRITGEPRALAEIAELLWVDPQHPPEVEIAPLTRQHILPLLSNRERPADDELARPCGTP